MKAIVRACLAAAVFGLVGCSGSSLPTGPTLTEQEKSEQLKSDAAQIMKEKQQSKARK